VYKELQNKIYTNITSHNAIPDDLNTRLLTVVHFRYSVAERIISISRRALLYGVSYTKGKFGVKPSAGKHSSSLC
jgi:hypothetical protein